MSTTQTHEPPIPDASEIRTRGPRGWRLANGQIVRGREEDNNLETTEKLVGFVIRVGVHEGVTSDGERYRKVECDIRTRSGIEHVGCNTNAKTASITFALGLLQIGKDDLIALQAGQSSKKNRYGSYSTYANWYKVNPTTLGSTEIKGEKSDEPMEERLENLLTQLRSHPLYKEREPREEEEGLTHRGEFLKEIDAKGWPNFVDHPAPWLTMFNAALGKKFTSLNDVPDDDWGAVRQVLQDKVEVPSKLKGLKPPEPKAKLSEPEDDPFA